MTRLGWGNVRIRTKLFLLLLGLILGPFLVYATLIVGQISGQMEALGFRTADLVLKQTAQFTETRAETVKRALDLITLDSRVRELSAADPAVYEADVGLWIRDAAVLRGIEDSIGQNNPDLTGFVLYMARGLGSSSPSTQSLLFRPLAAEAGRPWLGRLEAGRWSVHWFAPGDGGFEPDPALVRAVRRIPDDNNLQATVGWARADVKVKAFQSILDQAEFSSSTAAFLIDEGGAFVARSRVAQGLDDRTLALLAAPATTPWPLVRAGATDYRTASLPIAETGWRLVLAIPHRDIGAFGDQARNLLLLVLAVMLPFLVPLSLGAASTSTRRLEILLAGVRRVGVGGFDVELPVDGNDEFGELTANFNKMVERIHGLVQDQYRLGLEVKNLELQALQAQINPHFLYNTLDLISGLAQGADQPRIVETAAALSKFYRLSLSGGAEVIALADEFEHAATYVTIQNLRFDDAVVLETVLEDGLGRLPVMKMVLQPLVENAILHGIREKEDERGRITLRAGSLAWDGLPGVELSVEDDGVGIEPGVLARLLTPDRRPTADGHGYGVFNIDRRLRLRYGDRSGLRFASEVGRGTVVRVWIPR